MNKSEEINAANVKKASNKDQKKQFEPIVANSSNAADILKEQGICYDGEINMDNVAFSKIEAQQDCLMGSFYIPKLLDVQGNRYKILFFITNEKIVLVDDEEFSEKLIARINHRKRNQGQTKEMFLYEFMAEFMSRDLEYLVQLEMNLMELEELIQNNDTDDFHNRIMSIRRKLLILRGYYDEITDVGKALEENENKCFAKKDLKYFGTISDRADRLMNKTSHLLEYAGQVKDAYQAQFDAQQNSHMQFLTVITTIFFPLTLITGWYGMNFRNMPELNNGYPFVILLSVVIIILCIITFKRKKLF